MAAGRNRRVGVAVGVVLVIAVAAAAWFGGTRVRSSEQAAAGAAAPDPSWVTAPVERRVLDNTLIVRGDVVPTASTAVAVPLQADGSAPVVTGVFTERGDAVESGDRVVEVAGRPVFVVAGERPAYRTLRPGMSGADVAQLQAALVELGCDAGETGLYDEATKECVERLYTDAGYDAERTSPTEVADLAEAERAVAAARRELDTAEQLLADASQPAADAEIAAARAALRSATLSRQRAEIAADREIGRAGDELDAAIVALNTALVAADESTAGGAAQPPAGDEGGDGGDGDAPADLDVLWRGVVDASAGVEEAVLGAENARVEADAAVDAAASELAALESPPNTDAELLAVEQWQTEVDSAESALAELEAVSGPTVPFGELVFVADLPAEAGEVAATIGAEVGTDALLSIVAPTSHVEITLGHDQRQLVEVAMPVVLLDEVTGERVDGELVAIDDEPVVDNSGGATYQAIAEAALTRSWSGRNVRVTIATAATAGEVLVVPAAAVTSAADGETRVQVVTDDGTPRAVAVTVGLSADGYFEVSVEHDGDLAPGDDVVIGR